MTRFDAFDMGGIAICQLAFTYARRWKRKATSEGHWKCSEVVPISDTECLIFCESSAL